MPKGSVLSDSFEQLAELGVSTTKKGAQGVARTFSPVRMFEKMIGTDTNIQQEAKPSQKKTSTSIDLTKLSDAYKNQDKAKVSALKNRLFQLVKSGEQSAAADVQNREQQKQYRDQQEIQAKQDAEKRRKAQDQSAEIPHGKERRSIFSPRKISDRQHMETRPSSGKQ